jgi:hypothetical protein
VPWHASPRPDALDTDRASGVALAFVGVPDAWRWWQRRWRSAVAPLSDHLHGRIGADECICADMRMSPRSDAPRRLTAAPVPKPPVARPPGPAAVVQLKACDAGTAARRVTVVSLPLVNERGHGLVDRRRETARHAGVTMTPRAP